MGGACERGVGNGEFRCGVRTEERLLIVIERIVGGQSRCAIFSDSDSVVVFVASSWFNNCVGPLKTGGFLTRRHYGHDGSKLVEITL